MLSSFSYKSLFWNFKITIKKCNFYSPIDAMQKYNFFGDSYDEIFYVKIRK